MNISLKSISAGVATALLATTFSVGTVVITADDANAAGRTFEEKKQRRDEQRAARKFRFDRRRTAIIEGNRRLDEKQRSRRSKPLPKRFRGVPTDGGGLVSPRTPIPRTLL